MGSGIGSIAKFAIPLAGLGAMTMFPGMALGSGLGASASQALAATGPLGMFGGTGLAGVASPALAASVGGCYPIGPYLFISMASMMGSWTTFVETECVAIRYILRLWTPRPTR